MMAWIDSMRLRRRADKIRVGGWVNLVFTIMACVVHASDGAAVTVLGVAWAAAVMAVTHGAGWMIDRHAERVVRR
jgi:Na+/H+ antiporter NhaD/arsenite permease-like protein